MKLAELTSYNPWRTTVKAKLKNRIQVFGPPLLYLPALGNLAAWFDALDPASVLSSTGAAVAAGGAVALWADKSGQSNVNCLVSMGGSGNYGSTPDSAALSIIGDIDLRAKLSLGDWTPPADRYVISKRNSSSSYRLGIAIGGYIDFMWSEDGTTQKGAASTVIVPASDYATIWIRVTLDVNDGAGNNVAAFYTSTDGQAWTQLGALVTTAGVTSIADTADAIEFCAQSGGTVGLWTNGGCLYRAQILNGIGGSAALDADFTTVSKLATSFVCSTGQTITINTSGATGARISGARDLYQGTAANRPIYLPWSGAHYGWLNGVVGNHFSTPDSAAASITGDVEIVLHLAATDWTPSAINLLCDKWGSAGQRSWTLRLNTNGTLALYTSSDGTVSDAGISTVAPTVSDLAYIWIKVTRASATGVIKFYTSADGTTWVQLGSDRSNTAGAIFDSTATVTLGSDASGSGNNLQGSIKYASVASSIGGAPVVVFDPSRYVSGSTFTAANGEVWTVNGGAHIVTRTGLYFDGVNDYLKAAVFSLAQPETVHLISDQVSYTVDDAFFDGGTNVSMLLRQHTSSGQINMYAGTQAGVNSWAIKTASIVSAVFNGASSLNSINRVAGTTPANAGSASPNGLCLGSKSDAVSPSNIVASEVALYSVAHDVAIRNRMALYAGRKWRFVV